MSDLVHRGAGAFVLLVMMFSGSLLLWVGMPLACLWIGSQVEGATGSVAAAIGAMLVAVMLGVAVAVPALGWLSNRYRAIRAARGLEDTGHFALEVVLVTSAGLALAGFGVWFFGFSGSAPLPIGAASSLSGP